MYRPRPHTRRYPNAIAQHVETSVNAGQGMTTRILPETCGECGGRLQEVVDRDTHEVHRTVCRADPGHEVAT